MIPDWATTHLFFSDRLESEHPALLSSLRTVLRGVPTRIIANTRDIWCRDYMPVQVDEDSFCQFAYRPDYLQGHEHLITPPEACRLPFMQNYRREEIVLDGGNVVASRTKVILTEKVFKENPAIERSRLRQRLEEVFVAECLFIPKEPYDAVGHADGVVRFVSENRVLVNDYSGVDPGYGARLRGLLEMKGLVVETLPMFEEKRKRRPGDLPSAVGVYINYLWVGNLVVAPAYGRPEDDLAVRKLRQVMPDAAVVQVPCRGLADQGGVLNCVSWTVRRDTRPC
jgi:agmatine deiminase